MTHAATEISFVPITTADFLQVARWLGNPHVRRWWKERPTVAYVDKEYGGSTRGDFRTRVYIAHAEGQPLGVIQCYEVSAWPEDTIGWDADGYVGIDYMIAIPSLVGKGYGKAMIDQFISKIIKPTYPQAKGVLADPEIDNPASLGVLRSLGFKEYKQIEGEFGPAQLMIMPFQS